MDLASSSWAVLDGEYIPMTTILVMAFDLMMAAWSLSCSMLSSAIEVPSTKIGQ